MRTTRLRIGGLGLLLPMLLAACSSSSPAIVGEWEGVSENARGVRLALDADGTARWTIGEQGAFDLRYAFDSTQSPHHFDLTGFEVGPLAGMTLFGIVEFDGEDAIRWDAQPGDPESAATVRPSTFDEGDTRVMRRIEE